MLLHMQCGITVDGILVSLVIYSVLQMDKVPVLEQLSAKAKSHSWSHSLVKGYLSRTLQVMASRTSPLLVEHHSTTTLVTDRPAWRTVLICYETAARTDAMKVRAALGAGTNVTAKFVLLLLWR